MKRNVLSLILIPCLLAASVFPVFAAEEGKAEGKSRSKAKAAKEERAKLVTDGELAQWLVRVLGLSRFLPAAPTELECFQILMQNNIQPADGWQKDRTVTMGTLARVVVQGLGRQAEVKNPENDASWINFLKEIGIDFGTIGEAVENLEPLPQPVGPEAVITSTDPLGKLQRINPPDNQQIGADLSTLGRVSGRVDVPVTVEQVGQVFNQVQEPPRRPPMTPN